MDHPVQMLADRAVIAGMTFLLMYLYRLAPLQVFRLHPHRYPDVVALLLVSRHIRVQPYLPQPGPCFRFGRAMDIRRTACRMVLSAFSADVGERTVQYGLFLLLSDDTSGSGVVFSLPLRPFEKVSFVIVTAFFIYYLIYIFVPVAGPQFYFSGYRRGITWRRGYSRLSAITSTTTGNCCPVRDMNTDSFIIWWKARSRWASVRRRHSQFACRHVHHPDDYGMAG